MVDPFLLLGVHFRPRRVVALHDHWPFPALWRHVVLIVCCQFGVWQYSLGQDEFLGDGAGSEQSAHVGEV